MRVAVSLRRSASVRRPDRVRTCISTLSPASRSGIRLFKLPPFISTDGLLSNSLMRACADVFRFSVALIIRRVTGPQTPCAMRCLSDGPFGPSDKTPAYLPESSAHAGKSAGRAATWHALCNVRECVGKMLRRPIKPLHTRSSEISRRRQAVRRQILALITLLGVLLSADLRARAQVPFNLGQAGPQNFAVLGLGSPTNVSITGPSSVTGAVANVGVPASGGFSMSDGLVSGTVFVNTASKPNVSGPSTISGGITQNAATDARLAQAVTDAKNASTNYGALHATITSITAINQNGGNLTITGGPGVNVLNLSMLVLNGATVTLSAPAGASFVVNVTGKVALQGTSIINLDGGLTPFNVLYNVLGTGE